MFYIVFHCHHTTNKQRDTLKRLHYTGTGRPKYTIQYTVCCRSSFLVPDIFRVTTGKNQQIRNRHQNYRSRHGLTFHSTYLTLTIILPPCKQEF